MLRDQAFDLVKLSSIVTEAILLIDSRSKMFLEPTELNVQCGLMKCMIVSVHHRPSSLLLELVL